MYGETNTEKNQGYKIIQSGTEPSVEMDVVSAGNIRYQDVVDIIHRELNNIKQSFLTIGWYLKYIKDRELYKEEGYTNINDFASNKFHMSQSNVSRYINLCERFSVGNDSPRLDKKYEGFDYSQLSEMLPMKPEDQEKVTPDMTVKQIREMKKKGKKNNFKEMPEEDAAVSGQTRPKEEYAISHTETSTEIPPAVVKKQPEMPELKTDDERKQWLLDVEKWGLWYEDPNIQARYYKYDFQDGSRIIAVKYRYTCPPYMWENQEQYSQQVALDGSYYGRTAYHIIYSDNFWRMYPDECRKEYKKYYTDATVTIEVLVAFLGWFQEWKEEERHWRTVEFDTGHMEEKNNRQLPFLTRQYMQFYEDKGYIPVYFNAKDCIEINGDMPAPTLTTSSGGFAGAGSITTFDLWYSIQEILNSKTISAGTQKNEIGKLLRIAGPKASEAICQKFNNVSGLWKAFGEVINDETLDDMAVDNRIEKIIQAANPDEVECIKLKYISLLKLREDINWAMGMTNPIKQQNYCMEIIQAAIPEEIEYIKQEYDKVYAWKAAYKLWKMDYKLWEETLAAHSEDNRTEKVKFRVKRLTEKDCFNLMGIPYTEEDIKELKAQGIKSTTLNTVAGEGIPSPMAAAFLGMIGRE